MTSSSTRAAPGRLPLDPVFHDLTERLSGRAGLVGLPFGCGFAGAIGAFAAMTHGGVASLAASPLGAPSPAAVIGGGAGVFALMGLAAWLVIRRTRGRPEQRRHALAAFAGQLLIHALWLPMLNVPAAALAGAVVLAPVFAWTLTWFATESRIAGALLVPSLAWIGVVTAFTSAAALAP
jgi:hypothetical protein